MTDRPLTAHEWAYTTRADKELHARLSAIETAASPYATAPEAVRTVTTYGTFRAGTDTTWAPPVTALGQTTRTLTVVQLPAALNTSPGFTAEGTSLTDSYMSGKVNDPLALGQEGVFTDGGGFVSLRGDTALVVAGVVQRHAFND